MALMRNLEAIRDSVQVVGAPHDPGTVQIHEGSSGDGGGLTSLGYLLLSVLLFSIASAAFFLFWQIWKRRNQTVADGTDMEMRIQRRYETVEHWVITKRVCPHDEFSNRVLSRFCSSKKKNDTSDTDEEDSWMEGEEDVECPICMSTIGAGDIVSWSANENCSHVYHHECIKEWLLRHVECCMCKETYLPVDEKKGKEKESALQELSTRFAASSATSFYCSRNKLIRIPTSIRCTRQELSDLERRIFDGVVSPDRLVALRGGREGTTTHNDGDSPIIPQGPHLHVARIVDNNKHNSTEKRSDDLEQGGGDQLVSTDQLLDASDGSDNRCCIQEDGESIEIRSTTSNSLSMDDSGRV